MEYPSALSSAWGVPSASLILLASAIKFGTENVLLNCCLACEGLRGCQRKRRTLRHRLAAVHPRLTLSYPELSDVPFWHLHIHPAGTARCLDCSCISKNVTGFVHECSALSTAIEEKVSFFVHHSKVLLYSEEVIVCTHVCVCRRLVRVSDIHFFLLFLHADSRLV